MPGPGDALSAPRRFACAVGAVVLGALALRLFRLGANSFWVDEINVFSFVRSGDLLTDLRGRGGPFESPLHYVAVWLATFLPFGFETAARVPAAIFGTIEVIGLMLLARRLSGRRDVALLAGIFMAVAPFAVRYSQENRYYTTLSALHLISWWLVVRALQMRTRAAFLWWGVATALLLLAHPFAPLVVLVQVGCIAWFARREHRGGRPDEARALVQQSFRGMAVAVVIVAPWYLWGALRWVPDIWNGKSYDLNPQARAPIALDMDLFKRVAHWLLGNGGRWTLLALVLLGLAVVSLVYGRGLQRRVAIAVAGYTAGFFLVLVPLAHVLNTYFAVRRIEFLLPPMLLLAALGVTAIADGARSGRPDNPFPARRRVAAVSAVVVGLSLVAVGTYYRTEKSDYRELATAIAKTGPDDLVVVGPVDRRWRPSVRSYLSWRGVYRRLHFITPGGKLPDLTVPKGDVVWVTAGPPGGAGFRTRSLNSLPDLQVIAGDQTAPGAILPWFVSVSSPRTDDELQRELRQIATLGVLLPPPGSSLPWALLTGR